MVNARKDDVVEKSDMSRIFGIIKEIRGSSAIVKWADEEFPTITKEEIIDLALVSRY